VDVDELVEEKEKVDFLIDWGKLRGKSSPLTLRRRGLSIISWITAKLIARTLV